MIETALSLEAKLDETYVALHAELKRLEATGNAKLISWFDKYDSHLTWVVSENKELLASVSIDGFSDNGDYTYPIGEDDYGYLPRDHPELIRISEV